MLPEIVNKILEKDLRLRQLSHTYTISEEILVKKVLKRPLREEDLDYWEEITDNPDVDYYETETLYTNIDYYVLGDKNNVYSCLFHSPGKTVLVEVSKKGISLSEIITDKPLSFMNLVSENLHFDARTMKFMIEDKLGVDLDTEKIFSVQDEIYEGTYKILNGICYRYISGQVKDNLTLLNLLLVTAKLAK